ncbi:MAG TPA: hypothetical protein VL742_04720 [Casimicrobiaceae bacterium]|nr:hypothetical protein [Casimicrobiaceae bacterium]
MAASLKVVALATLLGTVVFAAERHLAVRVSPDEAVAAAAAPAGLGAPASPMGSEGKDFYYFPSQFAEPTGEPSEQPPTF